MYYSKNDPIITDKDYDELKYSILDLEKKYSKILKLNGGESIKEVEISYRSLVKKYHPDKVQHLGEEHQKGAEEKFRKVQEAYEQLQKELSF